MTIERFCEQIEEKKKEVNRLSERVKEAERIDYVDFHYHETEKYMGNYGYAEGDNSFTVEIKKDDDSFSEIKELYLEKMRAKLAEKQSELKILEAKKEQIEKILREEQ